jgi:hypothetical protein
MWDLWWTKRQWNKFISEIFGSPLSNHSTMHLHTRVSSEGWTIGLFVAAVQRCNLTPPAWTTIHTLTIQHTPQTHSKHRAAAPGIRQLKLFIGRPMDRLSTNRKQCRQVTGLLMAHCTLRLHLQQGPLSKCQAQQMWTGGGGGGIPLPKTLLMPSFGWA